MEYRIQQYSGDLLFATPEAFISAVIADAHGTHDSGLWVGSATGLGQQIPSEGGYLAPPKFATTLWDGARRRSLLDRLDRYELDGESITLPAATDDSNTTAGLFGGVRAYWPAEAAERTTSSPKVRQIKLEPQWLTVLIPASDKLLRNGGRAVTQWIERAAAVAIGDAVDDALIRGSGSGQPLGLLTAGSTVSVAKESGQTAATITPTNIAKMVARLAPASYDRAVWLAHPSTLTQLLDLVHVVGSNTGASSPIAYDANTRRLAGFDVIPCDRCSALGTVGDLILTDLSAYAAAVYSGGPFTDVSIHVRFIYAESMFRVVFPFDGQPWLASAITPAEGSDTLSTCIVLATRT